jgi:hypothetical protein
MCGNGPPVPEQHKVLEIFSQCRNAKIYILKGFPTANTTATHRFALVMQITTCDAGWSSPVARQAHNLKVVSSNLAPATNKKPDISMR